jgi:hypothetical protein
MNTLAIIYEKQGRIVEAIKLGRCGGEAEVGRKLIRTRGPADRDENPRPIASTNGEAARR